MTYALALAVVSLLVGCAIAIGTNNKVTTNTEPLIRREVTKDAPMIEEALIRLTPEPSASAPTTKEKLNANR